MNLTNQYANLGPQFSKSSLPEKPSDPNVLLWNSQLSDELGLKLNHDQKKTYFSGQQLPPNSTPVSMAYSGHQFGHFNPQLGDGRAHLLGELVNQYGNSQEIQLKGSGRTPFSRNGDGKCGIKPAVREYLMSEAMFALGVPTTRCLAVTTTGEDVFRQTSTPGAVVTRVANSHIRVGTFEYFAARGMQAEIKILADLTISRHYPEIDQNEEMKYIKLLSYIIDKQVLLITHWMRVGFIHGVMNTDNTLLSGETIDYGPCAMMGTYDPATVFSSIDHNGRYAFGNQAKIAQWNITRLAECLLPLVDENENHAIEVVVPLLEGFPGKYNQSFNQMMAKKLGFQQSSESVIQLQQDLLELMYKYQLDYTQTFVQLQNSLSSTDSSENPIHDRLNPNLVDWHQRWIDLLTKSKMLKKEAIQVMAKNNPLVIPRNHHVESLLEQVEADLTVESVDSFIAVLQSPYNMTENTRMYQDKSPDDDLNYQTFCGT